MSTTFWSDSKRLRPKVEGRANVDHEVTAVVVTHGGQRWLPTVLAQLAAGERTPNRVVVVDTAATDEQPSVETEQVCANYHIVDAVVAAPGAFGGAVMTGWETAEQTEPAGDADAEDLIDLRQPVIDLREGESATPNEESRQSRKWLWLLHDDSAPQSDTLTELLATADGTDMSILGCKQHTWRPDRNRVWECGVGMSPAGARLIDTDHPELDQGQYDDRLEIPAVSSAGMLVDAEALTKLGGFSTGLDADTADMEFCYRAHRAGVGVGIVTKAVVNHKSASRQGKRAGSPRHDVATVRDAGFLSLISAGRLSVFWRWVLLLVKATAGCLLAALRLINAEARPMFVGNLQAAFSFRTWLRARRQVRAVAVSSSRDVLHYLRYESPIAGTSPVLADNQGAIWNQVAHAKRRGRELLVPALAVFLPLLLLSLVATRALWFGPAELHGGALLAPLTSSWDSFWQFAAPWQEVSLGSSVPAPPYLAIVSLAGLVTAGNPAILIQLVMLLSPVLAGTSAYLALRGLRLSKLAQAFVALAYGLIPVAILAVDYGLLGVVVAATLLPVALRYLVRLLWRPTDLPDVTRRSYVFGVFLFAVLLAFSPPTATLLLVGATIVALAQRQLRPLLVLIATTGAALALMWPWSGHLLTNPALFLIDTGAITNSLTSPGTEPWQTALFWLGGSQSPPLLLGALLWAGAVVATLVAAKRPTVRLWFAVAGALCVAIALSVTTLPVPWSDAGLRAPSAGPLLVLGALLLLLMAFGARNTATAAGSDRRPIRDVVLAGIAVAVAATAGWWWISESEPLLTRTEAPISAFAASEGQGEAATRGLLLTGSALQDDQVSFLVYGGRGPVLGTAETAPAPTEWLDKTVAELVAGSDGSEVPALADAAIAYVQADTRRDRAITRALDSNPQLRRISTVDNVGLWEVADWQSRARLGDGAVPMSMTDGGFFEVQTPVTVTEPEQLLIAQPPGDWTVEVSSQSEPLEMVATDMQSYPITESGDLTAQPNWQPRLLNLLVPLGALVLLVGWSITRGRRV